MNVAAQMGQGLSYLHTKRKDDKRCVRLYVCISVCMYVCMYVNVFVCLYVCACLFACTYVGQGLFYLLKMTKPKDD